MYVINCIGGTHIGERETNEDRYFIHNAINGNTLTYFMIADGVGKNGGRAADIAMDEVIKQLQPKLSADISSSELADLVKQAMTSAHTKVFAENKARFGDESKYLATTLDVCTFHNQELQIFHAGDARVYLFGRDGLQQVTEDENKAQIYWEEGEIKTKDEQKVHPKKKYLLNTVGGDEDFTTQAYGPVPFSDFYAVFAATDGLYGCMSEKEIENRMDFVRKCNYHAGGFRLMEKLIENPEEMVPAWISVYDTNEEHARDHLKRDNMTGILGYTIKTWGNV